jgi:hypothetical protein
MVEREHDLEVFLNETDSAKIGVKQHEKTNRLEKALRFFFSIEGK